MRAFFSSSRRLEEYAPKTPLRVCWMSGCDSATGATAAGAGSTRAAGAARSAGATVGTLPVLRWTTVPLAFFDFGAGAEVEESQGHGRPAQDGKRADGRAGRSRSSGRARGAGACRRRTRGRVAAAHPANAERSLRSVFLQPPRGREEGAHAALRRHWGGRRDSGRRGRDAHEEEGRASRGSSGAGRGDAPCARDADDRRALDPDGEVRGRGSQAPARSQKEGAREGAGRQEEGARDGPRGVRVLNRRASARGARPV